MLKADKKIWSIYCYISRDSRILPVYIGGCLASMVLIGPVNRKCKKYYGATPRNIKWYNFGVLPPEVEILLQFRNIKWYKMDVFTTKCCGFLPHVAGFYHMLRVFTTCCGFLPHVAGFYHTVCHCALHVKVKDSYAEHPIIPGILQI
ncbi:uncharacterized protein EV154DRAFT_485885 [Mucor mucedo]|uniref:uncharacterized protein n=1 Tax=Mucor mucedo TaxID=29922 RepID=UPI0022200DBD|nr:uncharacterized protein EV154DRAFT_485885 [Mucor mucedo]KAI7880463.1 hypothetical protein EV154DRAFT_485885 [Mucor mucedo]